MIALPMAVTTFEPPSKSKSSSFPSKNSGVNDKSASHPKIPLPIHAIAVPYVKCSRPFVSPPNVDPMLGVKSQSPRAGAGTSATRIAAPIRYFFIVSVSKVMKLTVRGSTIPFGVERGASHVPQGSVVSGVFPNKGREEEHLLSPAGVVTHSWPPERNAAPLAGSLLGRVPG